MIAYGQASTVFRAAHARAGQLGRTAAACCLTGVERQSLLK